MNFKQGYKRRLLEIWGREPNSLDDLAECVIAVLNSQPNVDSWTSPSLRTRAKKVRVAGFAWEIRHSMVSNSHDCPISGVTNWGGRDNLPKGYPGYSGRVWIRYAERVYDANGLFNATLTYPGTGGWGSYRGPWENICHVGYKSSWGKGLDEYPEPQVYSWDYRFFDSDFTGLEQMLMWDVLSDRKSTDTHRFQWEDPEFVAKDAEFMEKCKKEKWYG